MDMGIAMWLVMGIMMGAMLVGIVATWGKSIWRRIRGRSNQRSGRIPGS